MTVPPQLGAANAEVVKVEEEHGLNGVRNSVRFDLTVPETTPPGKYKVTVRYTDREYKSRTETAELYVVRMAFIDQQNNYLDYVEVPNSVRRDDHNGFQIEIAGVGSFLEGVNEIASGVELISYSAEGVELDRQTDVRLVREGQAFRTAASVPGVSVPVRYHRLVVWDTDPPDRSRDSEGKDASKTTLMAEIEGKVVLRYTKDGILVGEREAGVHDPDDIKVVKIHAVVLEVGGGPAREPADVKRMICDWANRIYWQCGVVVELVGNVEVKPTPANVNLYDGFDNYALTYGYEEWKGSTITYDELYLFAAAGYRDLDPQTVDVFFVNFLKGPGGGEIPGGWAYNVSTGGVGTSQFVNTVVCAPLPSNRTLVAHELLHILTDRSHSLQIPPPGAEENLFEDGYRITDVDLAGPQEFNNQEKRIRDNPSGVVQDRY